MLVGYTLETMQEMLYFTVAAVLFLVLPGLIIGLIVAVFQAATQINEMTLSFLPKLIITLLIIAAFGPWMFQKIAEFTEHLIINIPQIIG